VTAHLEPEPALLTSEEAARPLGISRRTVVRLARTGHLRAIRLGDRGRWRIVRAGVEELVGTSATFAERRVPGGGTVTRRRRVARPRRDP
jgi:excisionase family DNA binding protein